MSGGSLNYLYSKEPEELLDSVKDLEAVEFVLRALDADDIALDVRHMIDYLELTYTEISALSEKFKNIFHAVEWFESADYGRDDVDKAIKKYRELKKLELIKNNMCSKHIFPENVIKEITKLYFKPELKERENNA